eukprot:CAMPEP_0175719870 /NCGR_PEP_ID=MMETSP0097-20121207/44907_1 /TAXON_ID=311494 /ORGANISM="Alexandrium monilatum, Strain CCMP3105" /LENGTH=51 /DNA_ID=CAMNT_0017027507 /DNA_START=60 /DNA_END=212 /DNA_ORIENTATION=+
MGLIEGMTAAAPAGAFGHRTRGPLEDWQRFKKVSAAKRRPGAIRLAQFAPA